MPLSPVIFDEKQTVLVHYHCTPENPRVYRGHLFVESKRHLASFADLTEDEAMEVGLLLSKSARLLKDHLGAEHVYIFTLGHQVPHFHVHLVPRYPDTPKEYWAGWKLGDWPNAPLIDSVKVKEISNFLQAKM